MAPEDPAPSRPSVSTTEHGVLLDRQPDAVFGRLTDMVAAMSRSPVVMFTIREDQKTYFQGAVGVEPASDDVPLHDSMCQFVLASGDEMVVPDVRSDPRLSCLPPARSLGAGSYAGFPVQAPDGETLGSLCVIDFEPRTWTPAELDMFRNVALAATNELALRAALHHSEQATHDARAAAERARAATRAAEAHAEDAEAHRRRAEHHAAEATELAHVLQEALLPSAMPRMPGLELATRYRPGASGADVLGDFYDVFPTPRGWGVVVGDVCGKGIHAARATALARSTVRALGHTEDDAETVLATLNEVLHVWFGEQRSFVTAAYATLHLDAGGAQVTVANGGHPAGFVVRADGRVRQLPQGGRVLGIRSESRIAVERVRLAPGDGLVMVTDGITEARRDDSTDQFEDEGVERVLLALAPGADAATIADAVCDAALAHAGGRAADDTAVVVVRKPARPTP